MASVLIRVELKGTPDSKTYEALHALMEGHKWSRRIVGDDGKSAPLPTAMYYGSYDKSIEGLAQALSDEIATKVWTRPWVFCALTDVMAWVEK